jgi:HD-GYP domain-containing protein (c-di-GMP phosphodiesterase class II)
MPVADISKSSFAKPEFARDTGLTSLLSVPLILKDKAIGGLTIYHRRRRDYDAGDVRLMRAIASSAAVAIENAQLFRDTINTLVSLARAIEARDPYTQGHSERVTAYAAALAEQCKINGEELMLIKKLGPMHDIGKVGIGDGLLAKPGRLTEAERRIMERHPIIGENIISPVKILQPGVYLVRHHHERLDGSGYPDGLSGGDIPTAVRIVSIADAYDAMTSKRPYRDALTREAAFGELRACSGTQFDPELVPQFIEALGRTEI